MDDIVIDAIALGKLADNRQLPANAEFARRLHLRNRSRSRSRSR